MTLNVRSGLSQFHIAKTCKNENHNPAIKKYKGSAKMTCKLQLLAHREERDINLLSKMAHKLFSSISWLKNKYISRTHM